MKPIRVFLVEDHRIVREGIRQLLEQIPGFDIIGEAADGERGVILVKQLKPDVVIMDVHLPGLNGIQATKAIKACSPDTYILALSAFADDSYVFPLLQAGASGYLLKTASGDDLARAIHTVQSGGTVLDPQIQARVVSRLAKRRPQLSGIREDLTERELDVLRAVAQGKSNKKIGEILAISPQTVQTHLKNIYSKLHMNSRTEVVVYAICRGWITSEQVE
jgi:DNA-binding NarL/FixJ family response regulator